MARIVFVDEDDDLRTLAESALSERGHTVFGAGDGLEGIELIEAQRPDLVVLDAAILELDGAELCRRLKHYVKATRIPVIFLTAMTDAPTRLRDIKAGAVMYMTKPFDVADLEARIETMLARSHTGEAHLPKRRAMA